MLNTYRNMKRTIRLKESELQHMIAESVKRVLKENFYGLSDEEYAPYGLYIDDECVEEFDTLEDAEIAYEQAVLEYPDSVIDVLSNDGEISFMGVN